MAKGAVKLPPSQRCGDGFFPNRARFLHRSGDTGIAEVARFFHILSTLTLTGICGQFGQRSLRVEFLKFPYQQIISIVNPFIDGGYFSDDSLPGQFFHQPLAGEAIVTDIYFPK